MLLGKSFLAECQLKNPLREANLRTDDTATSIGISGIWKDLPELPNLYKMYLRPANAGARGFLTVYSAARRK
jgi:hypothetical protein